MKWIKTALAGCVSLLAMTAHAHADFIFTPIAFALFAGPLGAVASFAAIYTGLQIAAYAAVLGAQFALSQRETPKINPGEAKNTFQEAESSEVNAIGRVRLGGLKAFGNTKSKYIYRLIWHSRGPNTGIENYHVGGYEVTIDPGTGWVQSPPWAKGGGSWMRVLTKDGDGTETAWADLLAEFPSLWTTAHRCRGIFQSLVRFETPDLDSESGNKRFQKLYQGGAPNIEITARVSPVYDPRAPGQNADDENTWTWTDNGILCAVHIMRRYPDLTSADFDWAFIAAEATRADAVVATKGGTEARARCWGIWPSESKRGQVMQQVLDSTGTEVVLSDAGLIRIRLIDDAPVSEIAFTSKHQTELNWKSGPDAVERPNICRIKYYSPERGYDMAEIDLTGISWARIEDEIDRYGEKVFDVDLPFCPSASQAQRIGRRLFLQARAEAGSIKTNMAGLAAWGTYYADIEDTDGAETMLCRIAPPRIDDEAGEVDIPFIVWPPALVDTPWNPATMEADPPDPAPDLQFESELDTPSMLAASVVQYPGGAYETRSKYTHVNNGDVAEANYRTYTDGLPDLWASMTEYTGAAGGSYAYVAANTTGLKADFRARWFDDDDGSYFSDPLTIDPMAINNAAPPEPTLNVIVTIDPGTNEYTFNATAYSSAMNIARIVLAGNRGFEAIDTNARPQVAVNETNVVAQSTTPKTVTITCTVYTSNGTASPPAEFEYVIPGAG